jgi:hypothetical protein
MKSSLESCNACRERTVICVREMTGPISNLDGTDHLCWRQKSIRDGEPGRRWEASDFRASQDAPGLAFYVTDP